MLDKPVFTRENRGWSPQPDGNCTVYWMWHDGTWHVLARDIFIDVVESYMSGDADITSALKLMGNAQNNEMPTIEFTKEEGFSADRRWHIEGSGDSFSLYEYAPEDKEYVLIREGASRQVANDWVHHDEQRKWKAMG